MTTLPERRLDNWIQAYLYFTRHHLASERFHLWSALGVLSATVNRNRWMDVGHHTLFPNLYILFVGPSGIGKSSSSGIAISLLREAKTKLNIFTDSITAAGLIEFMGLSTLSDENNGQLLHWTPIMLYASEIGTMLNRRNSLEELTAVLTELFNKEDDWETRKATNLTKTIVKRPNVTFFACCFQEWIDENITSVALKSGFLGRMLVVQSNKKRSKGGTLLTNEDRLLRQDLIHDLQIISRYYGEMKWNKEAQVVWDTWTDSLPLDFSSAGEYAIEVQGFTSRKAQYVQRLAMLHGISKRRTASTLDIEDFEFGLRQIDYCEKASKSLKIRPEAVRNKLDVRSVIIRIKNRKGSDLVPIREVLPYFFKKMSKEEVDRAINELCAVGFCELVGRKIKVIDERAGE